MAEVRDEDSTLLMQHFPTCIEFIDQGLAEGHSVLVHCVAGRSRSASVVLAWCMLRKSLTFQEAVGLVQAARPNISPNPGFTKQLKMWEKMKYSLHGTTKYHVKFRQMLLRNKALALKLTWQAETGITLASLPHHPTDNTSMNIPVYSCLACSTPLFASSNVIHDNPSCSNLLVEPMQWMAVHFRNKDDVLVPPSGSIDCPKTSCKRSLGKYSWFGVSCGCNVKHNPGFMLKRSLLACAEPNATTNATASSNEPSSSGD